MKAIVNHEYGPPGVLELEDIDTPVAKDDEVLVRVLGAGVNPGDWDVMHGMPYVLRPMTGLRRPRNKVLGLAIAGRVEAVGSNVSEFQLSDEVYAGIGKGGFAEYACVSEDALAPKPSNLTFEQAAAVPVTGVAALQGLRDIGRVQPGQKVLINGTSGGVGTFAVQIAKAYGADVTGVCSTSNVDLVRSIGADHVIDYTQEDFTRSRQRYDLIFDNVGNRSLADCRRALTSKGMLIPNSNKSGGRWIGGLRTPGVPGARPLRVAGRPEARTFRRRPLSCGPSYSGSPSPQDILRAGHALLDREMHARNAGFEWRPFQSRRNDEVVASGEDGGGWHNPPRPTRRSAGNQVG